MCIYLYIYIYYIYILMKNNKTNKKTGIRSYNKA